MDFDPRQIKWSTSQPDATPRRGAGGWPKDRAGRTEVIGELGKAERRCIVASSADATERRSLIEAAHRCIAEQFRWLAIAGDV